MSVPKGKTHKGNRRPIHSFLFTIVRHGVTDANLRDIIQGHKDVPLNSEGFGQAVRLGKCLAGVHFTHWYSSDLQRAFQTCTAVLKENKHRVLLSSVMKDDILRERNFGELEGKTWEEVKNLAAARKEDITKFTRERIESVPAMKQRASTFINGVLQMMNKHLNQMHGSHKPSRDGPLPPELHVIVFSHGGMIREMVSHIQDDLHCTNIPHIGKMGRGSCPNTGVTQFRFDLVANVPAPTIDGINCILFFDISHLKEPELRPGTKRGSRDGRETTPESSAHPLVRHIASGGSPRSSQERESARPNPIEETIEAIR
ncbi:unnamed protein product [Darwinula stevensoni]|uniref:Phosphoglycerate mutase n=1 Tax=Darwinula stevensoni TaxID=69355 RepID=A0A7R9FPR8_9CRUS|nr:unnamed protein product [Darwinula stevensoni]CAG0898006.1 unnamed protein product [Darwinula stevensoni]